MSFSPKNAASMRTSKRTWRSEFLTYRVNAFTHERGRSVGVMKLAASMMHIKHLAGLGKVAKQRVVAACALLLLVVPHRHAEDQKKRWAAKKKAK